MSEAKYTSAFVRELVAWKAEAIVLLARYDKIAETCPGGLGSSKVENLERELARLRAEIAVMPELLAALNDIAALEPGSKGGYSKFVRAKEIADAAIAKSLKASWRKCSHVFPKEHEVLREPNFNVAYGTRRVCRKCGAIEFENWCETRASGGVPRIYPPEDK